MYIHTHVIHVKQKTKEILKRGAGVLSIMKMLGFCFSKCPFLRMWNNSVFSPPLRTISSYRLTLYGGEGAISFSSTYLRVPLLLSVRLAQTYRTTSQIPHKLTFLVTQSYPRLGHRSEQSVPQRPHLTVAHRRSHTGAHTSAKQGRGQFLDTGKEVLPVLETHVDCFSR